MTSPARLHTLLPSIAGALGVDGEVNTLGLPEADKYVVLLVDGMGELPLLDHAALAPFLNGLVSLGPFESEIPSTTSVNLTSLGTGLSPGTHGMPGYTCRIPGTSRVLNTLRWDDSIDPLQWQPHRTMFERLQDEEVLVAVVNDPDFEHSGLTRSGHRGVPFVGAKHSWERTFAVTHHLEAARRAVAYCYESRLDFAGHAHGVDSPEWREALATIDHEIADLAADLPDDTVLVVTADHGMVDVPVEGRWDVVDHPALLEDVVVMAGEARFRHIHTASGREQQVAHRWRQALGDRAEIRLREDTVDWFGTLDARVRPRFGDVLVAATGDFAVFDSAHQEIELLMRGFHGSITAAERRVPLRIAH